MKNSICPAIRELERIYDILAQKYGLDKIAKRPIITIQTRGRLKNTAGWYWDNKWQYKKQKISEINICAETLAGNVAETLIHEMVHYHNDSLKINDCNAHDYHNKHFKERAENYGLNVNKSGRDGWNETIISKSLQKFLSQIKINKNIFALYRKKDRKITTITKMKKYTCGCTIVRCATDLQAKCEICKHKFIMEE